MLPSYGVLTDADCYQQFSYICQKEGVSNNWAPILLHPFFWEYATHFCCYTLYCHVPAGVKQHRELRFATMAVTVAASLLHSLGPPIFQRETTDFGIYSTSGDRYGPCVHRSRPVRARRWPLQGDWSEKMWLGERATTPWRCTKSSRSIVPDSKCILYQNTMSQLKSGATRVGWFFIASLHCDINMERAKRDAIVEGLRVWILLNEASAQTTVLDFQGFKITFLPTSIDCISFLWH